MKKKKIDKGKIIAIGILTIAFIYFLVSFLNNVMGDKMKTVVMQTNKGEIEIELYEDKAPISVENFLLYVESGFFEGTIFHRVIPGFMVQCGGFTEGLDKKETADKYGDEQVHKWRRGYSDRPPGGESLEDVVSRVKSYYDSEILPQIHSELNSNILIAAHGNSLRALLLVMKVYKIEEINSVELSTGVPIHIIYQDSQFLIKK